MKLNEVHQNYIRQEVSSKTDTNLSLPTLESALYNQYKITHPVLQIDQRKISFGQETLSFYNAPPGISFTPGVAKGFALYVIPISGNRDTASRAIKSIVQPELFAISSDGSLFYKEFADDVEGSEEVQKRVAQNALSKINTAKLMLESSETETNSYNNLLKEFISQVIEDEKEKRRKASEAKRNLDPFS